MHHKLITCMSFLHSMNNSLLTVQFCGQLLNICFNIFPQRLLRFTHIPDLIGNCCFQPFDRLLRFAIFFLTLV